MLVPRGRGRPLPAARLQLPRCSGSCQEGVRLLESPIFVFWVPTARNPHSVPQRSARRSKPPPLMLLPGLPRVADPHGPEATGPRTPHSGPAIHLLLSLRKLATIKFILFTSYLLNPGNARVRESWNGPGRVAQLARALTHRPRLWVPFLLRAHAKINQ